MNKKEIEEKLNNLPKDKYIYQRYNGIITKYIQKEGYYIDCATGISINSEGKVFLGKISENIIDLIECGDYVNGYRVTDKYLFAGEKPVLETEGDDTNCKCLCEGDIKTILTKERYMDNYYKVGEEDE